MNLSLPSYMTSSHNFQARINGSVILTGHVGLNLPSLCKLLSCVKALSDNFLERVNICYKIYGLEANLFLEKTV